MSIVNYFLNKWFNTLDTAFALGLRSILLISRKLFAIFCACREIQCHEKNDDQSLYVKDFKDRLHRVNEVYTIFISAAQSNTLDNMLEEHPETARDLLLLD